jgi:hypothetical protein
MRLLILAASLTAVPAMAAVKAPDRPVTDPKALTSPTDAAAMPTPLDRLVRPVPEGRGRSPNFALRLAAH